MNKFVILVLTAIMSTGAAPFSVYAAATRFVSPNYGVESIIFGGTGTLRSSEGSIPPVITDGPRATSITTTSATIVWSTDKNSDSLVLLGTASGTYPTQTGAVRQSTFTAHSVLLDRLKRGTLYFLRVRSADIAGNVVESPEISFTTDPGDITPPVLTVPAHATVTSPTTAIITWETDEIASSTVDYGIRDISEHTTGNADELTLSHHIELSGLESSQTYLVRVKSRDAVGNLYTGAPFSFQTPKSTSITDVHLSDITLDSAVIQWQTSASSSSIVEYGTSPQYGQKVKEEASVQGHIIRLSGLSSGTQYYFRISGTDQSGTTLRSDEYTFKTVILPLIRNFAVKDITSSSAALSWNSSSDIDELVRYEITASGDGAQVGKKLSGGNDTLTSDHAFKLADLISGSTYLVTAVGKDSFGNQAISQALTFKTPPDSDPPIIQSIKSDTSVDLGSKQSVQVLVSFALSEPGTSLIEYGAGTSGAYDKRVNTDTELGQGKFMVIPGLEPGSTYHFRIRAKDRAGNEAVSSDYLVLAPSQPVSLLDLIFGQVQQNFGWLGKLSK